MKNLYLILNVVVVSAILCFFTLCWITHPSKPKMNCTHSQLLGKACPICGAVSGIHFIEKGYFQEAKQIQPYSLKITLFLLFQLILRLAFVFKIRRGYEKKPIIQFDVFITLISSVFILDGFLLQTSYVFYKMVLTGQR